MTSTNGNAPRLRVDMQLLTLREQREVNRIMHEEFDCSFTDALQDWRQPDAVALAVWMLGRRDNPAFSRDDALDLSFADLDLVGVDDMGKAAPSTTPSTATPTGDAPQPSPVSGG